MNAFRRERLAGSAENGVLLALQANLDGNQLAAQIVVLLGQQVHDAVELAQFLVAHREFVGAALGIDRDAGVQFLNIVFGGGREVFATKADAEAHQRERHDCRQVGRIIGERPDETGERQADQQKSLAQHTNNAAIVGGHTHFLRKTS